MSMMWMYRVDSSCCSSVENRKSESKNRFMSIERWTRKNVHNSHIYYNLCMYYIFRELKQHFVDALFQFSSSPNSFRNCVWRAHKFHGQSKRDASRNELNATDDVLLLYESMLHYERATRIHTLYSSPSKGHEKIYFYFYYTWRCVCDVVLC